MGCNVKVTKDDMAVIQKGLSRLGINVFPLTVLWVHAMWEWKKADYKIRSDDEVAVILDICQEPCKFYDDAGFCKRCGCSVNKSKFALINKIRMCSQRCPEGKW